jgi:3-oxoacyl-[acyl-carrier protein] reductase
LIGDGIGPGVFGARRDRRSELFDVTMYGTINCWLAVRDAMRARGGGAIVNLSSHGGPEIRNAYSVSKLAVRGVTIVFAIDYAADGIRVNAVSPGLIATESALGDFGQEHFDRTAAEFQLVKPSATPDDVAETVTFLASDRAAFITGRSILINGGRTLFI